MILKLLITMFLAEALNNIKNTINSFNSVPISPTFVMGVLLVGSNTIKFAALNYIYKNWVIHRPIGPRL